MAIKIIEGNIFESKMQALVNPVNCVGVMGAGLAKEFKERFPENYAKYEFSCLNNAIKLGETYTFRDSGRFIINFPTKNHWRDKSYIADIESGIKYLALFLVESQAY